MIAQCNVKVGSKAALSGKVGADMRQFKFNVTRNLATRLGFFNYVNQDAFNRIAIASCSLRGLRDSCSIPISLHLRF